MIARHAFLVLALLVLAGCDVQRRTTFENCLKACGNGADCIERCGDATAKAFGVEKEAKHVFRWDKGKAQ